jgi:hypothetical protein
MTNRVAYDADFDSLGGETINAAERPTEVNKAMKDVLAADTYSRMPVIRPPEDNHVRLARGIARDGRWLRNAEVRELTGADEEELARAGTNWVRFLTVLVQRGTVSIGDEPMTPAVASELLIGDRETLILGIRRATFGNDIEFSEFVCPHCDESTELTVHLDSIPVQELTESENGEYTVPLRDGSTAVVRLPTGADQDFVLDRQQWTTAQQNTAMLGRCVQRIEHHTGDTTDMDAAAVRELGMADRNTILKFLSATQPGPRYNDVAFTHEACGREVPLPITMANLFLGN